MKIEELFDDNIPEFSDSKEDGSSVFTDEIRERIYSRIQRKLISQQDERTYNDSVSGVERYKRSVFRKIIDVSISIAAAAVITVSSLYFYGNRNNNNNKKKTVLSSLEYSDHAAIAKLLTENFISTSDYINGEVATKGSGRYFSQYSSRNSEWQGEDTEYYLIDDERFESCEEIYDSFRAVVTNEYFDTLKANGGIYLSMGIDEAVKGKDNTTAPVLVDYNGRLYTKEKNVYETAETPSEPKIQDNEKYDFSACIDADGEYVFDYAWNGTQWKISNVRIS